MTDTEYAIKIFNWITNNTNPETEKEVYINGVLKRFSMLPERNQQILSYHLRDGMTYKEIGEIYGISANAVRNIAVRSRRLFFYAKCLTPICVDGILEQRQELYQLLKQKQSELIQKTAYIDSLNRSIESLTEKRKSYSYPERRRMICPKDVQASTYIALCRSEIKYYEDLFKFSSFEDITSSIRYFGSSRLFEVLKAMWNFGYTGWILETYRNSGAVKEEIARKFAEYEVYLDRPELYTNTKQKADS